MQKNRKKTLILIKNAKKFNFCHFYKFIFDDVFFIASRLNLMYDGYVILLNLKTKKYEIHDCFAKNTYLLTLPFDCLDERTLAFVRKTSVKRMDKIMAEIDGNNSDLEKAKTRSLVDFLGEKYDL